MRNAGCYIMLLSLLFGMCGCGYSVRQDKDSEIAYEIATQIATAIGENDEVALESFFSPSFRQNMNKEDFDALACNYSFSIEKMEDWFINTSQSDTDGRYRITAGFYIVDSDKREYEIVFQYYVADKDDSKVGLSAIAFSSKDYFEKNDLSLPEDHVILVPSNDDEY